MLTINVIVQTSSIKMTNTTSTANPAIYYLLISAPLFENNFLISIPIFLIEILFLFPSTAQQLAFTIRVYAV